VVANQLLLIIKIDLELAVGIILNWAPPPFFCGCRYAVMGYLFIGDCPGLFPNIRQPKIYRYK
jgi:hypothetical protein